MMYQLYAYPDTYSVGVQLLLEEARVPYRIVNPKRDPSLTDAVFYEASPHGRVPALTLPDGGSMCESGAIALHLADSLCDQQFSVKPDSVDRGRFLQWLFYLSSTLQPDVMVVFHPERYFQDDVRRAALVTAAEQRLAGVWAVLEKEYRHRHLANRGSGSNQQPWLFGQGPTAVDFSLATVMLWPEVYPSLSRAYPSLEAMLQAMSERESFKRIMPWHKGLTSDVPGRG